VDVPHHKLIKLYILACVVMCATFIHECAQDNNTEINRNSTIASLGGHQPSWRDDSHIGIVKHWPVMKKIRKRSRQHALGNAAVLGRT
jgi:hypothetical protein